MPIPAIVHCLSASTLPNSSGDDSGRTPSSWIDCSNKARYAHPASVIEDASPRARLRGVTTSFLVKGWSRSAQDDQLFFLQRLGKPEGGADRLIEGKRCVVPPFEDSLGQISAHAGVQDQPDLWEAASKGLEQRWKPVGTEGFDRTDGQRALGLIAGGDRRLGLVDQPQDVLAVARAASPPRWSA